MTHKSSRIKDLVSGLQGGALDSRYLGYFVCLNRGEFYLAHEVLEDLWLESRGAPESDFYKALIQFTGAFVHLQKNRLGPAAALFRLSKGYLSRFPPLYHQLDVSELIRLHDVWLGLLIQGGGQINPLATHPPPHVYPRDIEVASSGTSR